MTDKEKQDIIDAVLLQIQNNSQSVDTLQLADSLNGVSSLPCVKGEELVSVPLSLFEKIVSDTAASSASGAIIEETNARISADANLQAQITETKDGNSELLKRIIGKSTASSAYTDPFKYLNNFASEKDENGTVTKHAIRVMQDALLDTLRHSDYHDSFPYIGHMRAHIEGVPIECWNYVKSWNTGSTNGVFVQVVRTNFGLKNGVISSALTEAFHEYHRTVTVGMANGSVTDVTATPWKESNADISEKAEEGISKADSALSQIAEETKERAAQDRALAEAVSNERAARTSADAELQAKITDHEDRIWKLENQWYGIEWDTEVSSPAVTRIGNMDLHRTLPIQSKMRGCLLDDNGKVTKYLNPKDWTGEVRDGSRGQVMVEIPMHYRRCETDGTKRRVKMSEYPLPGFNFVKMGYLSANEATIQRSTGKLASVVNTDPDFRGGNNQAEFDGTYKSVLGKPANYISLSGARTAARKRGKEGDTQWNCYTYDIHVTLTWLYVVEYANRNSQLPFTAELTSEGFHQGGLGSFSIPNADYNSYFKDLPIIPCGCTHHLGNGTGVVNLHLATDDGTYERDILVPRYRGVEVPFGHLNIIADGIFLKRADTSSAWTYYATSDPAVFGSNDTTQYRVVGLSSSSQYGYVTDINFGEQGDITTSQVLGGSSSSFFCDLYETYSGKESTIVLCGPINSNNYFDNGFFFLKYSYSQFNTSYIYGTRLCFLPAE